jgi:hypothetical protein
MATQAIDEDEILLNEINSNELLILNTIADYDDRGLQITVKGLSIELKLSEQLVFEAVVKLADVGLIEAELMQ